MRAAARLAGNALSRRRAGIAALACLGALLQGCHDVDLLPRSLSYSAAELQSALAQHAPYARDLPGAGRIRLSDPAVRLDSGAGRVDIAFELQAEGTLGGRLRARVGVSGVPAYRAAERALVLADARVDSLQAPPDAPALERLLLPLIGAAAREFSNELVVYRLRDDELTFFGRRHVPESIQITRSAVVVWLHAE
jgi:Protein of unknown function (DUF1439)